MAPDEGDLAREAKPAWRKNGKQRKPVDTRMLTARQERFAQALADAGVASQSAAFRLAYAVRPDLTPQAVAERASRLAHNAKVIARVHQIRNQNCQLEQRSLGLDSARLRNFVVANLYELAANAQSEQVRLGASRALGDLANVGLFQHRSEIVHRNAHAVDLHVEIAERLRALFGPAPPAYQLVEVQPIEPEPRQITGPDADETA